MICDNVIERDSKSKLDPKICYFRYFVSRRENQCRLSWSGISFYRLFLQWLSWVYEIADIRTSARATGILRRFSGWEYTLNQLRLMGSKNEIPEDYIYEIFRSWIFSNRDTGPTRMTKNCSPDTIWRRAPSHDERWRDFCSIALRYVTLGTSEADCERSLSKQKDCQGLHITRIGSDLLEWRLRAAHSEPKQV